MRYVIYGAGAIGGGIGARLAQHGQDTVLIARGAHLEAIQREGIRLRAPDEDLRVPVPAVGHPSEIEWRGDEVVLLCMKTQHTSAALDDLRAAAGTSVPIVCAQNGVENERLAARRFPHVYAMLVQMPATYLQPGEVILTGLGVSGVLHTGRYPSGTDATLEEFCQGLSASHFDSRPHPAILRLKYTKLLHNLENAVQAACDRSGPIAELNEGLRDEARRVFEAAGIDYASQEEFREGTSRLSRLGKVEGFERGGGSTWQSLARGAGSLETDYLNGEIILLGTEHGVPTPLNRALQDRTTRMLIEGEAPTSVPVSEILELARQYGAEI